MKRRREGKRENVGMRTKVDAVIRMIADSIIQLGYANSIVSMENATVGKTALSDTQIKPVTNGNNMESVTEKENVNIVILKKQD